MTDRLRHTDLANRDFVPPQPPTNLRAERDAGGAAAELAPEATEPPAHSYIKQLAGTVQPDAHAVIARSATPRPGVFTRLLASATLLAIGAGVLLLGRSVYLAMNDGWIAPLQLSPDSRDVLALRLQDAKEKNTRARLEGELASIKAEMDAIELGIKHLRALSGGYTGAMTWSSQSRGNQVSALQRQKEILETQRQLLAKTLADEEEALEVARAHLESGMITRAELQRASVAHQKAKVALSEAELEHARVSSAIAEAQRERGALVRATGEVVNAPSGARATSPDVVRFDDVQVNIQLQLARLEAEKRTALARERAGRNEIESMDQLRKELDETPLFLAMQQKMDIAFVPYNHLRHVVPGDEVYACRWFIFGCRAVGTVERIFPGEVITEDPWRSLARGQYVRLTMQDPQALTEQALRVRPRTSNGG